MTLSAYPFCQGEPAAMGLSRIPMARNRRVTAKRVNEWLKTDPDLALTVPIKERSLEIFGDEKRLDELRGTLGIKQLRGVVVQNL